MFNIQVSRVINADIESVFAVLTDHANYQRFRGIDASVVIKNGKEDANGVGAIRVITAGRHVLTEKITAFEYPTRFDYKIIQSSPLPYEHELGQVRLEQHHEGTSVVWRSKGRIKVPIFGRLLFDKSIQKNGARAFGSILKQVEQATTKPTN